MKQAVRIGGVVVVLATLVVAVGQAQVPARPPRPDPRGRDACKASTPNLPACVKGLTTDMDAVFDHLGTVSDVLENLQEALDAEQALRKKQEARIAKLEGEIATLKNEVAGLKTRSTSTTSNRVTAPFEVVDESGAMLLHVGPTPSGDLVDGVYIGRTSGLPAVSIRSLGMTVAQMRSTPGGGRVALLRPGDTAPRVFLDATGAQVGVADGKGGLLITMEDGEGAGPMVAVLDPGGNTLSGLGRNDSGGRVFANFKDNSMAFKAGAQPGGDADACVVSSKRGVQCLRVRLH